MPRVSHNGPRRMIGVKFAPEIQKRIDAIHSELSGRVGMPIATSGVMTEIVKRGLAIYERELGLAKSTKSTKPA